MKENLNKLLDENEDLEEEVAAHREELRSLQELVFCFVLSSILFIFLFIFIYFI